MSDINAAFHKLWTKAVGTEGYDKSQWKELGRLIEQLISARNETYDIAKRTFDRLLLTPDEAVRLDELRKVGQ